MRILTEQQEVLLKTERSLAIINGAIAPYFHFVHAERSKLEVAQAKFREIGDGLERLRFEVEEI